MRPSSLILLVAIAVILPGIVNSQTKNKDDPKQLTELTFSLFNQGRLDEAIKTASKVVSIERKAAPDSPAHVSSILNLARLKRDKFIELLKESKIDPKVYRHSPEAESVGFEALELYEEAIEINERTGRGITVQTADAKTELAWLTYNYKYMSRVGPHRPRIDLSERLFTEAVELGEKTRGTDADETLITVLAFGNFYKEYDNYEKAFGLYERYIKAIEAKFGPADVRLPPALRPYVQILHATFRDDRVESEMSRLEKITGKKETLPMGHLELYARSADAVNHAMDAAKSGMSKLLLETGSQSRGPSLKVVKVYVTVDPAGKVLEARADTKDEKLRNRAEAEVRKWFVRPYSHEGETHSLRGVLRYQEPK